MIVKRVLDDLRNIARPIPLERLPGRSEPLASAEVVESMQQHAETAGLTLRARADARGALHRRRRVRARPRLPQPDSSTRSRRPRPAGWSSSRAKGAATGVQVRIYDTGCGIPPDRLHAIFEDFVTTKRRGLGLGLAISKKIVEQLGGQIIGRQRSRQGHDVRARLPAHAARRCARGRWQADGLGLTLWRVCEREDGCLLM